MLFPVITININLLVILITNYKPDIIHLKAQGHLFLESRGMEVSLKKLGQRRRMKLDYPKRIQELTWLRLFIKLVPISMDIAFMN